MIKLNRLSHNMLDYQDYLSEFLVSSYNTSAFLCSLLCACFLTLLIFLFKSLKQLLNNFSWEIGESVRKKHFSLGCGSHDRMLPNLVHLHTLLTLLFFQIIEREYNEWTP